MNKKEFVFEVIQSFIDIDTMGISFLKRMAANTKDLRLKSFWNGLSLQKATTLRYWNSIIQYIRDFDLPKSLRDLTMARSMLLSLKNRIKDDIKEFDSWEDREQCFFYASYFIIYPLYESISKIYHYLYASYQNRVYENTYLDFVSLFLGKYSKYINNHKCLYIYEMQSEMLLKTKASLQNSMYDLVTGLFNKRAFYSHMIPLISLAQRHKFNVGFILIEINDMTRVQKEQGYKTTNKLLKHTSHFLRRYLRRADLIARYGNGQFMIYFSNLTEKSMTDICQRLVKGIAKNSDAIYPITVNIGAVEGNLTQEDIYLGMEQFLKQSEKKLRHAKNEGYGCHAITFW